MRYCVTQTPDRTMWSHFAFFSEIITTKIYILKKETISEHWSALLHRATCHKSDVVMLFSAYTQVTSSISGDYSRRWLMRKVGETLEKRKEEDASSEQMKRNLQPCREERVNAACYLCAHKRFFWKTKIWQSCVLATASCQVDKLNTDTSHLVVETVRYDVLLYSLIWIMF